MDLKPYVVEHEDYLALHFDARSVQSVMSKRDPYQLVLYPFQVMMWSTLLCPRPRSIVIIGLGGGSHAKWCWRYFPAARICVAEIDFAVIDIARRRFAVPADSDRFTVLHEDGAKYAAGQAHQVDLLIVDGANAAGVPDELGTQGFYDSCWASLRDCGVAVFNLEAGPRSRDRIGWIARRFRGVCWSVTSPHNGQTIVFAQRGGDQLSPLRAARLAADAGALAAQLPLDLRPALELFAAGPGEGAILAWGRAWPCRRMIYPH
jgi:spermidine synthase